MIVRVKYCGGCNSSYDRVDFVRRVQERFPSIEFVWGDMSDSVPDLALVVCGCSVKCAIKSGVQGAKGRIAVSSREDFPSVVEAIERAFSSNSVEK